jgi:hypothetical protein
LLAVVAQVAELVEVGVEARRDDAAIGEGDRAGAR